MSTNGVWSMARGGLMTLGAVEVEVDAAELARPPRNEQEQLSREIDRTIDEARGNRNIATYPSQEDRVMHDRQRHLTTVQAMSPAGHLVTLQNVEQNLFVVDPSVPIHLCEYRYAPRLPDGFRLATPEDIADVERRNAEREAAERGEP